MIKNIVITGSIGVGKTTICERIIEIAEVRGLSCGGVISPKKHNGDICVVDVKTRESRILASSHKNYAGPATKRFSFDPAGIAFGVKAIESGICCQILFVDEIGHLEYKGEGFSKIFELLSKGVVQHSVLVIRRGLLVLFRDFLRPDPKIYQAAKQNRDLLPEEILSYIVDV